jgi:hypothetical protein
MPPTVIPKEDNKFKVVISAAPVINKPKTEKKKKKEKKAKLSEPQDREDTPVTNFFFLSFFFLLTSSTSVSMVTGSSIWSSTGNVGPAITLGVVSEMSDAGVSSLS